MAEIRKHNQDDGDPLGKLVRDALGERIRPIDPGKTRGPAPELDEGEKNDHEGSSASSLPTWTLFVDGFTI